MSKATRHAPLHSPSERYRKPISQLIAVILIGTLLLTQAPAYPIGKPIFEAIGLLLVASGVLGRLWCALYIAGHKNSALRNDGPYSICRNPLYFFSFCGLMGITLYSELGLLTLILALLFLGYYMLVIRGEETRLSGLFGQPYLDYLKHVPSFWPNLRIYNSRKEITLEPALILRAAKDAIWFFVALAGVGIIKHLHTTGILLPIYWTWPF